jgi:hypothetical protein
MKALSEADWKLRFAYGLCQRFIGRGLQPEAALEDANAHADDQYPKRGEFSPEVEAELVFLRLPRM